MRQKILLSLRQNTQKFKEAAKGVLPIIGLLTFNPIIAISKTIQPLDYSNGCSNACVGMCKQGCTGCTNTCRSTCRNTSMGSCDTCQGCCIGSYQKGCANHCNSNCTLMCDSGCGNQCRIVSRTRKQKDSKIEKDTLKTNK